jgi:GTP-binding protein
LPVTGPINYNLAQFAISASTFEQCPPDEAREVAFVGRSNAGKSSAINVLTAQHKLARTSKTPGRTQLLNFFAVGKDRYLVDLPGFGYAKVSAQIQNKWKKQLELYLEKRNSLQGLVLLMDIRHPFMDFDEMIVDWCAASTMPMHILLTKADKLKHGAARATLLQVQKRLQGMGGLVTAQLFSALKHQGVDELRAQLDRWLVPMETADDSPGSDTTA